MNPNLKAEKGFMGGWIISDKNGHSFYSPKQKGEAVRDFWEHVVSTENKVAIANLPTQEEYLAAHGLHAPGWR